MRPIKILFVDDDPNILRALRRTLRAHRDSLDMAFAESGAAGLKELENRPVDVVVSDMRMPEMDGAAFLTEVKKRWPATVRIILSGYSEEEAVLRTVGPAHQFLSKPTDPASLLRAVSKALALRDRLHTPELVALMNGIESLPSPPGVYLDFVSALGSRHANNDTIARLVEKDLSLTTMTLKLVNSAFFGQDGNVTDIRRALQLLGFDTVKALALNTGLYSQFSGQSCEAHEIRRLSERSLLLGQLSGKIASLQKRSSAERDLATGTAMLAHIGTLLLLSEKTARFFEARNMAADDDIGICAAERLLCSASHAEIGAYHFSLWGFPDAVVSGVLYHHTPQEAPEDLRDAVSAVYVAQLLLSTVEKARRQGRTEPLDILVPGGFSDEDKALLEQLGLSGAIASWAALCAPVIAAATQPPHSHRRS